MARKLKTMDGNTAAAYVSYAFTEVAAIYPITPSSPMADEVDKMSANGAKNVFGQQVNVVEMQSEGGASGAMHGSLQGGALTTTYTASQGLLLMIPNMYKMAGELLPGVMHVSARSVATSALSIFGDHSDINACRQTGFAMLCSNSVQECMDLGAVAHLSAIKGRIPFLHFFDGFRTSHEQQKIEIWDYDTLSGMVDFDAVKAFRANALNPEHPVLRGTAQNPDTFFQAREACNPFYDDIVGITEDYMNQVNKAIGTDYALFNYHGAKDAEKVIIAMGSVCDTIEETIDYLNAKGDKLGLIKVRLYNPFSVKHFLAALPKTVKHISVLDRTKEPGTVGEPLYLNVVAALHDTEFEGVKITGGRYGLSSKDTTPAQVKAVYDNMKAGGKNHFTVGINDDVTYTSLEVGDIEDTTPEGTTACKFWGLGSDGTVGANKNSVKIIGDHTDMYAQAYFFYDSKKSGGITISHLRFGKKKIKSTYLINKAAFVACHNPSFVDKYDIVQDVKPGGTFLLNCGWNVDELSEKLPGDMKAYIAKNNIKFYTIDGISIGKEIGLGGRINTILQAAFFKLANVIPIDDAVKFMKEAALKSYGKKGEAVVKMNYDAIDRGVASVVKVDVPADWANCKGKFAHPEITGKNPALVKWIKEFQVPVNAQAGDSIPVSAYKGLEDGTFPVGSSAYEKRCIAVDVPTWKPENCIQCGFCSYVCPHAVIRTFALTPEEAEKAPEGAKTVDMVGMPGYKFSVTMSVSDCTGCGSCAQVCPGRKGEKALVMESLENHMQDQKNFDYMFELPAKPEVSEKFKPTTVKGSQFKQPLLEFSGACAGCGETPYAKLATQLYGDQMYIANATGCSMIWASSSPSVPYTVNKEGYGPAWGNSLFEDNAEYGFGIYLAAKQRRKTLADTVRELIAAEYCTDEIKTAGQEWLDTMDDREASKASSAKLLAACKDGVDMTGTEWEAEWVKNGKVCTCDACKLATKVIDSADMLVKKSTWILGGDGWAYDIGFGGLDHVIASGEDVNILVFDTEVYSNTGGQASKASQIGQVAQFAAAGKSIKKKDLAGIAMSYGYVYTAQVAMGADYNQCLKAFVEAENYKGPSIIIAYAPCINHGIKGGMTNSQAEEKRAVQAGYWNLFRYNPSLETGKFSVDSKEPSADLKEFLLSEVRYSSLVRAFPDRADKLFDEAVVDAKDRYDHLLRLQKLYNGEC
ncbi:MAG TPA: pyruvate:ferredoxin (flavodoxin) oxidoreductase [Clostridiales bacterium]|nr:pyruvate:ferredoxin (flavodoxin) oxidoreductase [Clostridiales bacterium]HPK34407.1 pyruvate:ferredoxin (flavodoxin) oxidoreductase [Oscillospiraceae bacterium]HPR76508.1 pyruvate:ferredoxin (flavodoxin) oxidoreductase [Oscillospiraceae bacterium]